MIGTLFVAATWARTALPCDCMPPPPAEQAFAEARVVALVRVVKVEREMLEDGDSIESGPLHIRLEVARAWKGAKEGDVVGLRLRPR